MKKREPKRNSAGEFIFKDYPDFKPNLSPREIFSRGSFGGTYWRPIYSSITHKKYKNIHKKYTWFANMSNNLLTRKWSDYDKNINFYKVRVGTTLQFWECKGWITREHPYGWVHWYCDFFAGKRGPDDERQIARWQRTAGPNSRFRRQLINMLRRDGAKYNDFTVSPKIRQTLQHWAYILTAHDV